MNEQHDKAVKTIATEIIKRLQDKQPVHISKGGVSHFVPLPNDPRRKSQPIDISMLNHVLEVDQKNQICVAEPGVTFAELVRATLPLGLIPTVVPELEGITVGGAVAGCSVESMSYRYGGFFDSVIEAEVITGQGEIVVCSREKEPLAFEMIHGSYGTLGVVTKLKFKLIAAKPFVKMQYLKFDNFEAFSAEMNARCESKDSEFIDAIVHDKKTFVLCLGTFVNEAPYLSNYRWLNIFYKSTRERKEDYLTTFDYCFRYDTECHWLSRTVPGLENKLVRLLIGKIALGSTNMIRWSKRLDKIIGLKKRPDVVVDVFIPAARFDKFYQWYEKDFDFYPLWVIPYRISRMYGWVNTEHARKMPGELFMDCAVYGKRNSQTECDYSELLEQKTYELGGIKTLISRNHYTRERFWQVYHRENYEQAKLRLDPKSVFPGLYEKFHRAT